MTSLPLDSNESLSVESPSFDPADRTDSVEPPSAACSDRPEPSARTDSVEPPSAACSDRPDPADRGCLIREGRWLRVEFKRPQSVLSWALVGGGKTRTQTVAWYRVTGDDLKPPTDPRQFLKERLGGAFIPDAVGLLTSGDLDLYTDVLRSWEEYSARCIATVGLSNALRVGDPPSSIDFHATIDLLCRLSHPLSEEAFVEAISIAAEARSLAVLEARIPSTRSVLPATGTGTDCIVIAAPDSESGTSYSGKHTVLGHLIGSAVLGAVRSGVDLWRRRESAGVRAGLSG